MNVAERQNSRRSLDRLIAQRLLYSRVKRIENWRLVSVAMAVSLLILDFAVGAPWFSQVATVVVVLSWSIEQGILVGWSARIREESAAIQEDFDCFVLEIPWPEHRGIQRPTDDRIGELTMKLAGMPGVTEGLGDWYGRDEIPGQSIPATVYCQRASCRWDARLRKKWMLSVRASLALLLGSVVVAAAFAGASVMELVLVAAASLRVLAWLAAEFREQSAAKKRMERLHAYLSHDGPNERMSTCDVRLVQDAIFEHRRSCPTIPDWFYRLRRATHQELLASGTNSRS